MSAPTSPTPPHRSPSDAAPAASGKNTSTPQDPALGPSALFAPWRQNYVENVDASAKPATPNATAGSGSFLLDYWRSPEQDTRNHVVRRNSDGIILLNKYPYTGGHLLVALGDPRPTLLDYTPSQRAALWSLVDLAAAILERGLSPQGMNIGINQGRAAGAGVPQHLHVHLVPRWSGDTNFMASIGQVRVIPSSLETMAERLRAASSQIDEAGKSRDF